MIPETKQIERKPTHERRFAVSLRLAVSMIPATAAASMSVACLERITIYESESPSDEPDGGSLALGDAGATPKPASGGDGGSTPKPATGDDAGFGLSDAASPEPGPEPTAMPQPDGGSESTPAGCFECPCDENQSCEEGLVCSANDTCVGAVWASSDPVSDQALIWDEGVWQ